MFTFRVLNSYRIFQIVLILIVSSAVILGQTNKNCAKFNEYCQNHWDCCSNSCMSYNYRCTHGYNVHKEPSINVLDKPTVTLEDILHMNFGQEKPKNPNEIPATETKPYYESRFGKDDDNITPEIKIFLQNSQETTEEVILDKQTPFLQVRIGENEQTEQPEYEVTNGVDAEEKITTATESQSNKDDTIVTQVKKDEPCKEIGLKCYTNDECCSKRCHGFLHQCVT